tara:strand:+ start:1785 stop:2381 length:597 start_codon:yes stop_codon:yes gene_type:complete
MRLFWFFFLHLIVFFILITSYSYAEDKVFTCKPVIAGVPLKNGEYYFEKDSYEKTPLIDKLTITKFLIDNDNVFYKNNKNRKFEQLIPSEDFNNVELSEEHENIFLKAKNAFKQWDQMIDLKNYKSFIFLYSSFEDNGNLSHSIKRVSIHKQNYMTSEITVPMTNDMPSYFIGRLCKGEKETDVIQHFFEELINKKLS